MNEATAPVTLSQDTWKRYRDNLPRHLISLARYLQSRLMHSLIEERGHANLGLHFGPYIALAGETGIRLSELAGALSISKQAVNQVLNQIENAGYLQRVPDPNDGRARRAVLTDKGLQLRDDGAELLGRVEHEFIEIVGSDALLQFTRVLLKLYESGDKQSHPSPAHASSLGWLLPRLSDNSMQSLMELTRERGHPGLKMSYGQVLTLMTPEGGRIQEMARINEVSKQAISTIALELEELGYLLRVTDAFDARQLILVFTARGVRLMEDSIESVRELEKQFTERVGSKDLAFLKQTAEKLYQQLGLDRELAHFATRDIENLAAQLLGTLGEHKSRLLATHIIQSMENSK